MSQVAHSRQRRSAQTRLPLKLLPFGNAEHITIPVLREVQSGTRLHRCEAKGDSCAQVGDDGLILAGAARAS